jgi:hypothetical protein
MFVKSMGLWRWCINIILTIMVITHRPVFYFEHNVSEIGFCLRLQVEPSQMGPLGTASQETESSILKFMFQIKRGRWTMSRVVTAMLLNIILTFFPTSLRRVLLYWCKQKEQIPWAFSPQAIYTDWTTETGRRNLVPTFVNRGMSRGQSGGSHTAVNLSFICRSRYFSLQ